MFGIVYSSDHERDDRREKKHKKKSKKKKHRSVSAGISYFFIILPTAMKLVGHIASASFVSSFMH